MRSRSTRARIRRWRSWPRATTGPWPWPCTRSPGRSSGSPSRASSVAWFFYLRRPEIPAGIARRFSWIYRLLDNKYYFDWFNEHVLARGARLVGTGLWRGGDVRLIDGVFIDGSAKAVGGIAALTRRLQSGYLYWYALVMIVGVIGLMTWQLWPFLGALLTR